MAGVSTECLKSATMTGSMSPARLFGFFRTKPVRTINRSTRNPIKRKTSAAGVSRLIYAWMADRLTLKQALDEDRFGEFVAQAEGRVYETEAADRFDR